MFTKGGLVWDEHDRLAEPRRTMRHVRREVEDSLRRLGVERIDLYQVHWPDADGGLDEYWQTMADLKREGKVRAIGLSNHDASQLEVAERIAHVDAIQPPFSALNRRAAAEVAWAREHGTAVIAYSPLQSGLLTGAFSAARVAALPDDDWRRRSPDFTTRLAANLAVTDALRAVARRLEVTVAEVAIAWVLAWPGISGAIVGARRPEQVDGWAGAVQVRLTPADVEEIAAALRQTTADAGPVRP